MYLDDDIKNQGCGSKLLNAIEPVLSGGIAFCLPFSHLGPFYTQAGFRKISVSLLPDFLQDRLNKYTEQNLKVIAMRRDQ